jgi:hypothetical protein
MHGSNARNLSVQLFLSQITKNGMSFLLSLMIYFQKNWTIGQNRYCLEARGVWGEERRAEGGERNSPNNVWTYE